MKQYTLDKTLLTQAHVETVTKITVNMHDDTEILEMVVSFKDMQDMTFTRIPGTDKKGFEITLGALTRAAGMPAYTMFNERLAQAKAQLQAIDEFRTKGKSPTQKQLNDKVTVIMTEAVAKDMLQKQDKILEACEELSDITKPFDVVVQYLIDKDYTIIKSAR